jgi:YD repeat-containing protein
MFLPRPTWLERPAPGRLRLVILPLLAAAPILQAVPHSADESHLAPLESFFIESSRFAERISPCGGKVAYLGPDERAINRLWMVNLDEPENTKRISTLAATTVRSFFWIGNGDLLWQTNDAEGRARLYLSSTESDQTREILPNEKRRIQLEGVVDSKEPCILAGLSDDSKAFPDLYRVDLRENEAPVLAHTNPHQIITWAWDAQGALVAGLRWTNTGAKELLSLRESPVRVIFRAEPTDDLRLLMASSDGNRALVITDRDSNFTHAEWIDLTTGFREQFGTDPKGRVDLEGLFSAGDDVLAVSHSDENHRWHALDPAFTTTLQALNKCTNPDSLSILGIDESRSHVLFKRYSAQDAGAVWLHDAKIGTNRKLWRERLDCALSSLCDTRPIQYKARDGTRIPAYLTLPKEGKAPWPLVIFPHGGPRMRTHPGFDGRVQFLASRGYAVIQPNFRGSRGYGKAFMNAGDGQWGKGVMQTDVTDGVDHLIHEGVANPKRVAILGGSYGGYAALAGLAFTPDRYAAGICLFGISDLIDYATHHPAEWQAYAGDTVRRLGDPSTAKGRKSLHELSPVNNAAAFKAPLMIYHGAKDKLIPVSHAQRMVDALKQSGKSVDYLLASEEAHGFSNPESEMAVYRAIELFLHKHLGGKAGPCPPRAVDQRLTKFRESALQYP